MARPGRVYPEKLHLHNHLHTEVVKMMSGVTMTALHLLKETDQYYKSLETWAFCASNFKKKKKYLKEFEVNIPELKDKRAIEIVKAHSSANRLQSRIDRNDTDAIEALAFLDKIFPEKKKAYFYELQHLIGAYCHGHLGEYDDEGKMYIDERILDETKNYNTRYCGATKYSFMNSKGFPDHIQKLHEQYEKASKLGVEAKNKSKEEKDKAQEAYNKWQEAVEEYNYEHNNVVDKLFEIGKNTVVCPYAFTKGTGTWAIEEYGRPTAYSNSGEIFFIVDEDTVYFEVVRHF